MEVQVVNSLDDWNTNLRPSTATSLPPETLSMSKSRSSNPLEPTKTYNGGYTDAKEIRLRIANGGAGQSGLVGALADAFVKWCVEGNKSTVEDGGKEQGSRDTKTSAFLVGWYLGDTTQSLAYLSSGWVDIAFTYNEAAEKAVVRSGKAVVRKLIFLDHFYLVGPPSNPAGLTSTDLVYDAFAKIVDKGARDALAPPSSQTKTQPQPTRFLSRFDKSATNIKESGLFIDIGQVPWAHPPSPWYHIYPRFPRESLRAASVLGEYTLTDRGTWLSSEKGVREGLRVFKGETHLGDAKDGEEDTRILLNPCNALLGSSPLDKDIAVEFMRGDGEMIYSPMDPNYERDLSSAIERYIDIETLPYVVPNSIIFARPNSAPIRVDINRTHRQTNATSEAPFTSFLSRRMNLNSNDGNLYVSDNNTWIERNEYKICWCEEHFNAIVIASGRFNASTLVSSSPTPPRGIR
ncbi:extracellular tungstate binding [Lentinula edodes]|uniref:Extracellular tungstate binding n=1 Tax=Lentinula edodes TaxID=5353 RepID=A0A1Q3EJM2_LENED|nr:extracellular tungstate binding [Lentinula edodes]